jgi:hypothetical protein
LSLALALPACSTAADPPVGSGGSPARADLAAPTTTTPLDLATPPPDLGPPYDLGDPIVIAPSDYDQWVWVPIDEMVCADGTPAGVGVRFTRRSNNLVIWFQGNGVCYDLVSCTAFQNLLTGMGADPLDHLWWSDPNQGHTGVFDPTDATNPFRDDNWVVLPHCAVDGHTADKDSTYPPLPTYHQHGYRNATEAMKRILPTFWNASRIVVAGFSAGGIGATANYHQIAVEFESVGQKPPFLIMDSGPLMRDPYLSQVARDSLNNGWGLASTIGIPCPTCITVGPSEAYPTIAMKHPGVRASILSAYADDTASNLYHLLNYDVLSYVDPNHFHDGLIDLDGWIAGQEGSLAPSVQRDFFYPGNRHGALYFPLSDSPGLVDFLNAQLNGDPNWASVVP